MRQALPLSLRQKDQLLISFALVVVVLLSWAYLFDLSRNMQGMSAGLQPWAFKDFLMMFIMWSVMMVGMMVPSAMRTILIYTHIVAKENANQHLFSPSFIFVLGYIAIWSLFSVVATSLQWAMEATALLSPMMVMSSSKLGAALLVFAGVYQLTPLKDACLKHCQSPVMYLANHYRKGKWPAFLLGFKHGIYCLGCCWLLMSLLFVGGVMNLVWILAISLFVLAEKLSPPGIRSTRISSFLMILAGSIYLVTSWF